VAGFELVGWVVLVVFCWRSSYQLLLIVCPLAMFSAGRLLLEFARAEFTSTVVDHLSRESTRQLVQCLAKELFVMQVIILKARGQSGGSTGRLSPAKLEGPLWNSIRERLLFFSQLQR
jgi:hypothetical protein